MGPYFLYGLPFPVFHVWADMSFFHVNNLLQMSPRISTDYGRIKVGTSVMRLWGWVSSLTEDCTGGSMSRYAGSRLHSHSWPSQHLPVPPRLPRSAHPCQSCDQLAQRSGQRRLRDISSIWIFSLEAPPGNQLSQRPHVHSPTAPSGRSCPT